MSTPPPDNEPRAEGPWDALLRAMLGPDAELSCGVTCPNAADLTGPELHRIRRPRRRPARPRGARRGRRVADNPEALDKVLGQIKRVLDSSGEDP